MPIMSHCRLSVLLVSWLLLSWRDRVSALPPNVYLGTCLDAAWVTTTETSKHTSHDSRESDGRLTNPFMQAALQSPRYTVDDSRITAPGAYGSCKGDLVLYPAKSNGSSNAGHTNGTIVLDLSGWTTHSLTTMVFSILAQEVIGYEISFLSGGTSSETTQRMSSVGAGLCTPTHGNMEVWVSSITEKLQMYANESYSPGGIGYVGLSGLYTTRAFVDYGTNLSTPFFADFWKHYVDNDDLINAVNVSTLMNNSRYYPPSESGCDDGELGCLNSCSKSAACTARENQGNGAQCMVVIMMYASYDRGYLQATMSNLGIPAYFCFLSYTNAIAFVVEAQQAGRPVVFYHYEPDMFHQAHPGLFERVFLPRALPEKVLESTATYGENGYGNATNNPVAVDFPDNPLGKYAASRLSNLPVGSLVSKFTITELNMNSLLNFYIEAKANSGANPDPYFSAACSWVKGNYDTWKLWIDRLPLCTYDDHMRFNISESNDTTARVIDFSWIVPNPANSSLPYACDGGLTVLPSSIVTSRSLKWLQEYERTWKTWIRGKPACDASFYEYSVSGCDSKATRTVTYAWLLPDPANQAASLECEDGVALPSQVTITCEYMPASSPAAAVVAALAIAEAIILLGALVFVHRNRRAPIIKRSQSELLELMLFGGLFTMCAAVAYAGRPTHFLCGIRPILISFGFTTIFGSLVVKSLRVYRVFMQKAMKRTTVTLRMMFKVLASFYLTDTIIFLVWFGADFPAPTTKLKPAIEFSGEVSHIACHSSSFIFSALLMFWKAILLFAGLYLSFLIRKVSVDFQESMWIFSSAVVVLFACLVIMPLAYLVDLSAPAFYVFLSGMLILCTAMVMGLMIIPKLLRLNEVDKSTASASSGDATSAGTSASNDTNVSASKRYSGSGTSGPKRVSIAKVGQASQSSFSTIPVGKTTSGKHVRPVQQGSDTIDENATTAQ